MKKNAFRSLLSLLLLLLLLPGRAQVLPQALTPEVVGMSASRLERMDAFLQKAIETQQIAGAVSLIARRGHIVQHKTFGFQDKEQRIPMQPNTLFYIQSMTKPIVTAGIMMLYEEGYFELNDPVSRYLPQFEQAVVGKYVEEGSEMKLLTEKASQPITIVQLMTHTAGMLHGLGSSELDKQYVQKLYFQPHKTIAERVDALAALPLVDQPGASWHYSAAPDVLALLIEHFSGMSAADFLQQRIFDPLGMKDTGYNVVEGAEERVSMLYESGADGTIALAQRQVPRRGHTIYGGTHGLYSTAEDYLRFCLMMLNQGRFNGQQLLSSKTVELMTTNHVGDLYPSPGQGFGLGFGITTNVADSKRLGSAGMYYWSGAYSTFFFIDPEEELISILMLQLAPYNGFYGRKHQHFVYQAIID